MHTLGPFASKSACFCLSTEDLLLALLCDCTIQFGFTRTYAVGQCSTGIGAHAESRREPVVPDGGVERVVEGAGAGGRGREQHVEGEVARGTRPLDGRAHPVAQARVRDVPRAAAEDGRRGRLHQALDRWKKRILSELSIFKAPNFTILNSLLKIV